MTYGEIADAILSGTLLVSGALFVADAVNHSPAADGRNTATAARKKSGR